MLRQFKFYCKNIDLEFLKVFIVFRNVFIKVKKYLGKKYLWLKRIYKIKKILFSNNHKHLLYDK